MSAEYLFKNTLEGTAAYSHLLLAPVEGWWPSATLPSGAWGALWVLLKVDGIILKESIFFKTTAIASSR